MWHPLISNVTRNVSFSNCTASRPINFTAFTSLGSGIEDDRGDWLTAARKTTSGIGVDAGPMPVRDGSAEQRRQTGAAVAIFAARADIYIVCESEGQQRFSLSIPRQDFSRLTEFNQDVALSSRGVSACCLSGGRRRL